MPSTPCFRYCFLLVFCFPPRRRWRSIGCALARAARGRFWTPRALGSRSRLAHTDRHSRTDTAQSESPKAGGWRQGCLRAGGPEDRAGIGSRGASAQCTALPRRWPTWRPSTPDDLRRRSNASPSGGPATAHRRRPRPSSSPRRSPLAASGGHHSLGVFRRDSLSDASSSLSHRTIPSEETKASPSGPPPLFCEPRVSERV